MKAGEVIIKFKPDASRSDVVGILSDLHATRLKHFRRIRADHERISGISVESAIHRYRGHRAVEFIEPNYLYQASVVPDDPDFPLLWGLHNTGQVAGGTPGADISALDAWDVTTGSRDIVVAIIDTGIDYTHPDLAANIYTNPREIPGNGRDDDGNGFVDDVRGWDFRNFDNDPRDDAGHGTHVAGTVGAVGNNGVGVVGVNWHVRLMPLKFLGADGFGTTAGAIGCVEYATMMGVQIMSASWGGGGFSEALRQAIFDANNAGILFVAAAGNEGQNTDIFPNYPSGFDLPNIISVAATTPSDSKASFSNYGLESVDLGAPGVGILSTTPGNTYSVFNGTSMATPHVSGALALVLARYPGIAIASAKALLLNSVDRIPSLSGLVLTGGRLNAARALQGSDSIPPDPILDLAALGTGSNTITVEWTATGDDGRNGTASEYDIRYAAFAIHEDNFNAAPRFQGAPRPAAAGSHERIVIQGLSSATTYYVAMKARDEFGNASPISNVVSASTLEAPDIQVSPDSLSAALLTGAVTTRTLTLRNLTGGTLDFGIDVSFSPAPPGSGGASPAGAAGLPPAGTAGPPLQWSDYARAAAATSGPAPPSASRRTGATTLPSVITDPPGDAPIVDLIELRALSERGNLQVEMEFSTEINPFNFGGFLSLDIDQNRDTGRPPSFGNGFQDIGTEFEFDFFTLGAGVLSLRDAFSGTVVASIPVEVGPRTLRFTAPLALLGNDDGSIDVTGVLGDNFGPTDWFPDSGHGTIMGRRWLSFEPGSGTVSPGGSVDVAVTFDASGLFGGGYDALIRVASNDPDEPEVRVPARLEVTGVTDIELSSAALSYGSVFVGGSRLDSLVVTNAGTDRLDVTEVSSSLADFLVSVGSFSLDPGERRVVMVTFHPGSVGEIAGTLRVRSNDPDEGELSVSLTGTGLVPPEISVSPGSMSAALLTGQTDTQTLTISNTGGNDLSLQITVRRSNPPLGLGPGPAGANPGGATSQSSRSDASVAARIGTDDAGAAVLVIQDTSAWGLDMGSFLLSRFGITPTVIRSDQIASTDFTAYDLVITVGDEGPDYYGAISANVAKFEAFLAAGGTVQYQLATQGDDVSIANGVLVRYGNLERVNRVLLPDHPIVAGLPALLAGNFANHCTMTQLPARAKVITETAVSHLPTTVEYSVGPGNVIATGMPWEFLYLFGYEPGPMLYQATAYSLSLAHPRWMRTAPPTATVPPGGSVDVAVTFDASGLFGGGYDALIRVASNDPDEPEVRVPARLEVTGVTDIELSSAALSYGSVFVGGSRLDSLVVTNAGTDRLDVTEVSSSLADFLVSVGSFSLDPGERRVVMVTFHPGSVGEIAGTLRVRSNDPDEGELSVSLTGTGLVPPEISVSPGSMSAALLTGQTDTQTLTISNTGGNDLSFRLFAQMADSGAPVSSLPRTGGIPSPDQQRVGVAAAVVTGPTPNGSSPSTGPVVTAGEYSGSFLRFGITDYGEIMPFQYPLGNEHLRIGSYYSGYTVAYFSSGQDHVAFAATASRSGIVPVSYQELVNTLSELVVQVVTRTSDGSLEIRRLVSFQRDQKHVRIESRLRNTSAVPLTNVVFKAHADWDVDGDFDDDAWDYDPARHMTYASDVRFVAIASGRAPDLMDAYGWNDYDTRATTVDYPYGPIRGLDGMEVLHFELGDLAPSSSAVVATAYGAGDNLEELQQVMTRAVLLPWLSFRPESGTVPPGASANVAVTFNATGLFGGDYPADIAVENDDPTDSEVDVPAVLHVTAIPLIRVEPSALDFGTVFLGSSLSKDLTVFNDGTDRLSVTAMASDRTAYVPDASAFTLDPGGARVVHMTFTPTTDGSQPATFTIEHNAAGSRTTVALTGTGLVPPVLSVSPVSIYSDLPTGGRQDHSILVSNGGGSDLHFTVTTFTGAASVAVRESASYGKGEIDPRVGDPVTTGSGGPDRFGYTWADSDEPNGPSFGWVEISAIGSEVPISGDDETSSPIPIGFQFKFYDTTFTSFQVCTNGFLSFTSFSSPFTNQPLPSLAAPENLLAAFWDDLFVGPSSRVLTHTDGSRMVVEFQNVLLLSGAGPFTFEVILFPTGTILYQYLSMGGPTTLATVGFQNGARDDGATIAFDAPYLHDHLAIRIASAPSWLRVVPASGTVPAGTSAPVQATVDATGVFPGDYAATIRFGSDDPVTPSLSVPVTLHARGVPHLEVDPISIDFGNVFVGQSATRSLTIRNMGTDVLTVTSIGASASEYTASPSAFSLPALQSLEVLVTFTPAAAGTRGSTLTILSNDPSSPHVVSLAASALIPPVVGVSPREIVAAALPGGQKVKTLRVCNTGGSGLDFTVPSPLLTVPAVASGSYVGNGKGSQDPRSGILGTGGPDAFGHVWTDSDDPGGPTFRWIDITSTGTRVPFGSNEDDRTLGPFPIGFGVPFFGATFDSFRVSTNGWVSFTSDDSGFDNQPLPNSHRGVPENLLAICWDDLVLRDDVGSSVYFRNDGAKLIIQFNNLRPFNLFSPALYTFEVFLYPSGAVQYQYLTVGSPLSGVTVGIQNAARDDGLTVSFNSAYLHGNLAILFTEPPRWIEVSPSAGVVPSGGCVDLAVHLDASQLAPADYSAAISVMSNDPSNPRIVSNVLFHVGSIDAVAADVDPNTLNLDSNGRFIHASLELPAGLDPNRTVLSTVRFQGQVPCSQDALAIGDFNHDGIADLRFQFDRAAVEAILTEGDPVPVTVTGEIEDTIYFVARHNLRVIRPRVHAPNGGETLVSGGGFQITWSNPEGWHVDHADLYYTTDDGVSWTLIAQGVIGQSYVWPVPAVPSSAARVRVYLYDAAGIMGYDSSDGVFRITQITAVASEEAAPPAVHALFQNSPNPFNPTTSIRFDLPVPSSVLLMVYDIQGRTVQTLLRGWMPAGRHRATWDGRDDRGQDVASGIYYYRLWAGGFQANKRMLLLK